VAYQPPRGRLVIVMNMPRPGEESWVTLRRTDHTPAIAKADVEGTVAETGTYQVIAVDLRL